MGGIGDYQRAAQNQAALLSAGRAAPAEDVVDALERLNRALSAACRAGWLVTISVSESNPAFAGEGAVCPVVSANLQRQV